MAASPYRKPTTSRETSFRIMVSGEHGDGGSEFGEMFACTVTLTVCVVAEPGAKIEAGYTA
jgi:hypothetical protein